MNSFINARLQRKLRKFAENPLSGSWVSGPTFRVQGLGSRAPPMSRVPGFGSRVLKSGTRDLGLLVGPETRNPSYRWDPGLVLGSHQKKVPCLGSHFSDMSVTPTYKKEDSTLLKNYRPISVPSVVSKILKDLFKNNFTFFIYRYLSSYLCGCRKRCST